MDVKDYSKFISGDVILGYDTVLGYLVKNAPHEIEEMIDAVTDTIHLNRLCVMERRVLGHRPCYVWASEILSDAGIAKIEAFPLSVLKKVLAE